MLERGDNICIVREDRKVVVAEREREEIRLQWQRGEMKS